MSWWHCYTCDLSRTSALEDYDAHLASAEHLAMVRAWLAQGFNTSAPSPLDGFKITRLPMIAYGLEKLK